MKLKLQEVAVMSGGVANQSANLKEIIKRVVIDSRLVGEGTLFVAIKGDNHDGHDFVNQAFAKGASAALVSRRDIDYTSNNLIYVDDLVKALGGLAQQYRKKFNIPMIGITGSNGKTTVKEMVKSICEHEFGKNHVLATSGNLNNHLGVPLTLLSLTSQHQVAIIEMGMNHVGELEYLSGLVKPTIAVVNNVMMAHAEFFKDLSAIAKAKGEIYHGLVEGGIACINVRDSRHDIWLSDLAYARPDVKLVSYGTKDSNYYIMNIDEKPGVNLPNIQPHNIFATGGKGAKKSAHNNVCHLMTPIGEYTINLQILGQHNCDNALTAVVLAFNIGCGLHNIQLGLSNYVGYKRRLEQKSAFNGAIIIDDSYNANLESAKAAILALKNLPKPHWFILADFKELGKFSESAHKEIGKFAKQHGIERLLTYGELAQISHTAFDGDGAHFKTKDELVAYCLTNLPKTATLLVKGSNSMQLDKVIEKLL